MNTQLFLFGLGGLGVAGTLLLLVLTAIVLRRYSRGPAYNFRRYWRAVRLKQLAALACLFFLAMTASYAIFLNPWALVYLLAACKTGTWWMRFALTQRA